MIISAIDGGSYNAVHRNQIWSYRETIQQLWTILFSASYAKEFLRNSSGLENWFAFVNKVYRLLRALHREQVVGSVLPAVFTVAACLLFLLQPFQLFASKLFKANYYLLCIRFKGEDHCSHMVGLFSCPRFSFLLNSLSTCPSAIISYHHQPHILFRSNNGIYGVPIFMEYSCGWDDSHVTYHALKGEKKVYAATSLPQVCLLYIHYK